MDKNNHKKCKIVIDTTPPPRYKGHISTDDGAMKPRGDFMTIYTKAISELENGNINAAWEIAKNDPSLKEGVTMEAWVAHSLKAIAAHKAQSIANSKIGYID